MGLARLEDKCVCGFDGGCTIHVPYGALARNDVIKLPLSAVGVVGIVALARRNAAYLDIEGMPLPQVRRLLFDVYWICWTRDSLIFIVY